MLLKSTTNHFEGTSLVSEKLIFITEARFYKDKTGRMYCDAAFDQNLWNRYLNFFSEIVVFARVQNVAELNDLKNCLSNERRIRFVELPYYLGLRNLITKSYLMKKALRSGLAKYRGCSIIIRVPGAIGYSAANILRKLDQPYAIEVVGDPYEVFAKGNFNHPLRFLLQKVAVFQLKFVVYNASAALYVTRFALQNRYPVRSDTPTFATSDVRLPDDYIATQAKTWTAKQVYSILCVGSLAQMYKAPDIILKAIQVFNKHNSYQLSLKWLGDGEYREPMQLLAKELGVDKVVDFLGNVSSDEVFSAMKATDLFILASRTEGLPRVVVEAMGTGLPIIATHVGGIPELLHSDALIEKNDFHALVDKISEFLDREDLYNSQAKRNLIESHNFKASILNKQRLAFYSTVAGK